MNSSISFRLLYLLGVSSNELKADYPENFKESDSLKFFEFYIDARLVRELVILRQYMFENFAKYKPFGIEQTDEKKRLWAGIQKELSETVEYIENKNIPIQEIFIKSSIILFVNVLSKMINNVAYKVFLDLDIPFVDEMLSYIRFPEMTEMELTNCYEENSKVSVPYKRVILNIEKLKHTLKYVFLKDINCIQSGFSLCGKAFDKNIENNSFTFIYRKEMGEDLDSDIKINGDDFLKYVEDIYKEEMCKIAEAREKKKQNTVSLVKEKSVVKPIVKKSVVESSVKEQIKENSKSDVFNTQSFDFAVETLTPLNVPIYTAEGEINRVRGFLKNSYLVMLFDLTTISLFSALNFLQYIQNTSIDLVFLYDENQKYIFNPEDYGLNIEKVHFVEKKNKNIQMSAVIMREICKYVYKSKMTKILLFSESWELIELLNDEDEKVDCGIVCSYKNKPLDEYNYFNLDYINWTSIMFIMSHILVESMVTLEISKWKVDNIVLKCKELMLKYNFLFMSEEELYDYVLNNMDTVRVKLNNRKVMLECSKAKIQII